MKRKKALTNQTKFFHENVTYDSKKEQWSGVAGLLFIPAFILLVGWGVSSTFNLPKSKNVYAPPEDDKIQMGVGGGISVSKTPMVSISPSISPDPTDGL